MIILLYRLCKTRENSNFLKKGQNRNFGKNPNFFLDLG